jgi:hypothetical protein
MSKENRLKNIENSPYGDYFRQIAEALGTEEKDLPALADWWEREETGGALRYMALKHADNGANNARQVMALLIEEVKANGISD